MSAAVVGMAGSAIAGVAGSVGGAIISSGATRDAAQTQADAATRAAQIQSDASKYAVDAQTSQFAQQQANIAPWIQAGKEALPQLSNLAAHPDQFSFTKQDFLNNQDPAYQFNLDQGQQALERSAAARGSLMSGGTLKDLTSYSQGMASNEYGNAYNRAYGRFMDSQNTQFNRLASLSGIGQVGTGQLANAGMNMANNVGNIATGTANSLGNIYTGLGNAQAGAAIAQGNIWGNTLSGLGNGIGRNVMDYQNMNMMNNWMNKMYPQTPGGGGGGAGGGPTTAGSYTDYGSSPSLTG